MPHAYYADRIFTGEEWLKDVALIVEKERIIDIVSATSLPQDIKRSVFGDAFIAPAFIDIQIYGAHDRLLAVFPQPESIQLLVNYCHAGGAKYCLPTVATNTMEVFYRSIDAIRNYWEQGGIGVLGLHLEGPWLNPLKKGAHIASLIHKPEMSEVRHLLEYGKGVIRFITLAPEVCDPEIIALIQDQGIIISAGHSNATYAEARSAFRKGVTTVTHLFNAMSPLQHREPGLVGAVMDDAECYASIIPDGYHVDFAALRIAKKAMGERLFVITDAVTSTSTGHYQHYLAGDKYEADGILSGSSLDMARSVRNLIEYAGIGLEESLRMCSLYPARVMKMDQQLGQLKKGFEASMVVMSDKLEVIEVI